MKYADLPPALLPTCARPHRQSRPKPPPSLTPAQAAEWWTQYDRVLAPKPKQVRYVRATDDYDTGYRSPWL